VDNTGINVVDIAPYCALALAYGHDLKIITLLCDPEVAAARNVHGVPPASVKRMARLLASETWLIPSRWPQLEVESK